ncbi:MAG: DUF932 domain-containing protein [Phycisphaerae bacterium]|jgi:phage/plasmid-like protein (TIGR03299 family)
MREDLDGESDCPIFGIVSDSYTPLQNCEAFSFFDDIVGQKAAIYHTAGALGKGDRIWVLARLPGEIRIAGDDITHKYLLLSYSHGGTGSVQIIFAPVRVACQNTLTLALNQGPMFRISHYSDLKARLRQSEGLLGLVHRRYAEIEETFKSMAKVQLDDAKLDRYLHAVFPDPPPARQGRRAPSVDPPPTAWAIKEGDCQRVRDPVDNDRDWARYFFRHGKGNEMPGVSGTLWAAYNAVAELTDHRQTGLNDEWRLTSAWFGEGYQIKARALAVAVVSLKEYLDG